MSEIFWKNFNFEKLSNAERTRQFHKSIQKMFPTPKSKKYPEGGEGNEVHLGLPCGRQKSTKWQRTVYLQVLRSGKCTNVKS